jgi:DNA-binding FadR family transcriptional regulator
VLEGTSARLAALHASPAEIDALKGMLRKEESLLSDLRALAVHNRMFHRAIYLASRNRYLIKQLESIQSTGSLLGRTTRTAENRVETSLLEHTAIIEAIANRQEDAAENAMRQHIRETQKARVLRFL